MAERGLLMNSPFQTRRGGFTLVEMLVVVTIIAILVGVLLPQLNRGKDQATRTKCTSNMRQIVMAMMQYARDKETFPEREKWLRVNANEGVRGGTLYNYLGESKVYVCPADTALKSPQPGSDTRLSSYAFNEYFASRNANTLPDMSLAIMLLEYATGEAANSSPAFSPTAEAQLSDRHNGGGNIVFGDAHAEYFTLEKYRTNVEKLYRETPPTTQ